MRQLTEIKEAEEEKSGHLKNIEERSKEENSYSSNRLQKSKSTSSEPHKEPPVLAKSIKRVPGIAIHYVDTEEVEQYDYDSEDNEYYKEKIPAKNKPQRI